MVAHKRPHIERAALQLFVKRGLRGTTVRDIATRARVAEGTLYRHWRSKRDLARSVFRDCARTVASALRHEAAGERPARDKLAAAVRALFRCARGDILLYEMLNRVAIHRRFGTLPRRLTEYQRELTDAVLASLEPRRRRRAPA